MRVEATDIRTKIVMDEDQDGDVKYAIKATVKNNDHDGNDDEVIVTLQGIDKEGFEVETIYLSGHVPVGGTKVLTTRSGFLPKSTFDQISEWQQE